VVHGCGGKVGMGDEREYPWGYVECGIPEGLRKCGGRDEGEALVGLYRRKILGV
jgi:hypothetical protein